MPKRDDLGSIVVIGAGPIVIGQACEFDYSGVQACKALREEGYRVILINTNPATIMTDPEFSDATYIEPLTIESLSQILRRERPNALLSTMGGQTALNCSVELARCGLLKELNIELIGAKESVIEKAENRLFFRQALEKIGLECPKSVVVKDVDQAQRILQSIGLPAVIRPSFTLGGSGSGLAYTEQSFTHIVTEGLKQSPIHEVLIEESVLGWKEYELEIVRDKADNCIVVCTIENVDPMGVHTGDSITVAPALTLTDKEYQRLRNAALAIVREIGVDTGGANVQFAINPQSGEMVVIEMNPRVSRSSALASKATGFPIAKIAAKLAIGYTLDELPNDINKVTPASFEPTLDYIVTKIPRFTFEKFPGTKPYLSTSMKSIGEVMAIGSSFPESLQKALRSLETGLTGLNPLPSFQNTDTQTILQALRQPTPERILLIAEAFRHSIPIQDVHQACHYDPWFLKHIQSLVIQELRIQNHGLPQTLQEWWTVKSQGFSDARLAELTNSTENEVTQKRRKLGVLPVYKRIDTCAAEFSAPTPYMYSTYEQNHGQPSECESDPSSRKKVIILGAGPNRIGQGIEFDYCCVHAAFALRKQGLETIMINCNPETVSTDYDTSDRLYFEPLTVEDVKEIIRVETQRGYLLGVLVQFGGQTPLKLAKPLEQDHIPILGTSPNSIDLTENRQRFKELLQKLHLQQPKSNVASTRQQAEKIVQEIGYPVMLRPSYVLGGRAMQIVFDQDGLHQYIDQAMTVSGQNPVLIDQFLKEAIEVDVDFISDNHTSQKHTIYIAGIMQHIEEAGIHSGDSACVLPPYTLSPYIISQIQENTQRLAQAINVIGLGNIQMAVKDETVYILEVNPRASRTVPFVSKATGIPLAQIAAHVMTGTPLQNFTLSPQNPKHIAVKESVFPFRRFDGVDVLLGPEMKSTGEVMGLAYSFSDAFAKSQISANILLPHSGTVLISVKDSDKPAVIKIAALLVKSNFHILATPGTATYLLNHQIPQQHINTIHKKPPSQPNIIDAITIYPQINMVINTTEGPTSIAQSFAIRQHALINNIPYYTTLSSAHAAAQAIHTLNTQNIFQPLSLQEYYKQNSPNSKS